MVRDRDGREIIIGDQVIFLTRDLFLSERGTVYRVSDSGARVMACKPVSAKYLKSSNKRAYSKERRMTQETLENPRSGGSTADQSPSPGATSGRPNTQRRRQTRQITSNSFSYKGQCEEIGVLLALRSEKFDKKVRFQVFIENSSTYVISNLKDGGDIQCMYKDFKDPTANFQSMNKSIKPDPSTDPNVDEVDVDLYKEEVKQFVQRKMNLRRNIEKSYGLIWGQCSSGLKQYIKGLADFKVKSVKFDAVWLLRELKKATSGIDNKANTYVSKHRAIGKLYRMRQGAQESNDHYFERFKSYITAMELAGGDHLFILPSIAGMKTDDMAEQELLEEHERSQAVLLLERADEGKFCGLMDDLEAGTRVDRDEYPKALSTMYELMIKYTSSIQAPNDSQGGRRRDAITLVQTALDEEETILVPGTDTQAHDIKCFNCNQRGHYASNCPESRVGVSNLQYGNMLTQVQGSVVLIPSNWILLDTCSSNNVVNNESLIECKRSCNEDEILKIHTNGGSLTFEEIGKMKYLPMSAYYNARSITNVLSLKAVDDINGLYVTMNTKTKPGIFVEDGVNKLRFKHSPSGLFYCTIEDMKSFFVAKQRNDGVSFLSSSTTN